VIYIQAFEIIIGYINIFIFKDSHPSQIATKLNTNGLFIYLHFIHMLEVEESLLSGQYSYPAGSLIHAFDQRRQELQKLHE
jgi:hypothetical protein